MNLLPEKIKKEIRQDFYKRVMTMVLALLLAELVLGIVPLLISYVTASYQTIFLEHEIAAMEKANKSSGILDDLNVIKDLNDKLTILNKAIDYGPKGDISNTIMDILSVAKPGVRITSISYGPIVTKKNNVKGVDYVVNVGGVANTRDTLLAFSKRLGGDKTFTNVDLPIGDLIESKNSSFLMTLTLAKK